MRPDRSGLTRRALLAGASGTLALGSRQAMAEGIEEQGAKDVDTSDGAVIAVVGDPQLGPMVRDGMQLKIEQINATLNKADLVIKRVPPDIEAGAPDGFGRPSVPMTACGCRSTGKSSIREKKPGRCGTTTISSRWISRQAITRS
jgi:hypothetical protein